MTTQAPGRIGTQAEMVRDALTVHDAECCTAQAPCALRTRLAAMLARYGHSPLDAHAEPPAAPQRHGTGSQGSSYSSASPASTSREATAKQVAYLRVLAAQRDYLSLLPADRDVVTAVLAGTTPTARDASRVITALKATVYADAASFRPSWQQASLVSPAGPAPSTPQAAPGAPQPPALTDGIYLHGETVYKVQKAVHGSGRLYAKVLVVDAKGEAHFDYAPGAVHKLTPGERMDLAAAKAFGALYGVCCRCAATLTDDDSIAAGVGPYCAGKL